MGQIFFLCALALFSNDIAERFGLPLPGSIVGLAILYALLQFNVLKIEWIELGANLLLAELLLFFIPSAVGIVKYQALLAQNGMQILVAVIAGTLIVMISSGLIAKKMAYARKKA